MPLSVEPNASATFDLPCCQHQHRCNIRFFHQLTFTIIAPIDFFRLPNPILLQVSTFPAVVASIKEKVDTVVGEDIVVREKINVVASTIVVAAGSQTANAIVASSCVVDGLAACRFAVFGSIGTHNISFVICILFKNFSKAI